MRTSEKMESEQKDDSGAGAALLLWQMAWLKRHEPELILRMDTKEIVDRLIQRRWVDPGEDIYQRIEALTTIANDRARLLLGFVRNNSSECFWGLQEALAETGCEDLAIKREDEQVVVDSFSSEDLTSAFYWLWQEGRPASVVKVNKKLKELYRELRMRPLGCVAGSESVSLDKIHVNICLLNANDLVALCDSPGQNEPFAMSSLKDKASSVVELEDMFQNEKHDRNLTSGIAGSGKSTAFMEKAPYEWAKVDRRRQPFWGNISLFFRGKLTNRNWWEARNIAELFSLARYDLTKEEEKEAVKYIKSHSEQVLLVADALDEATVYEESLLWEILTGKCEDLPRLKLIVCSRPCERALQLSKQSLFHQRLEVVGFTDEKIGQFVESFFAASPQKANKLRALLVDRPEVGAPMHTHSHSNADVPSIPAGHGIAKHSHRSVPVCGADYAPPVD